MSTPPSRGLSKSWLAHPLLSVLIGLVWLMLQQSLALPQLITATVLGLVLPRVLRGFLGPGARPQRFAVALRFSVVVLYDIVVSNLVVARIVLWPGSNPQPAWVHVPLDIRHPNAIALLATIITTTPGTVSCIIDEVRHEILVHALDCSAPDEMAAQIKQRYELPLKEILG